MTGAVGQQRVPASYIRSHPIPLAPLPEQQRIVKKLGEFTARTARAMESIDGIPSLIDLYRQQLLGLAFSGSLTSSWRAERSLGGNYPVKSLSHLITKIVAGKNLRCEERPPRAHEQGVVKVSAVTWGEFNPYESKTLPADFIPTAASKINSGDFLISRANTLELVASAVIVGDDPQNLFLSDKILKLELPDTEKPWLLWYLRSPQGRKEIEARATGNQLSMRNLSQRNLLDIPMPWPPEEERREIVRQIEMAQEWLGVVASERKAAAQLLPQLDAAIFAKAFRGELVAQNSEDEPASSLLQRFAITDINQQEKTPRPKPPSSSTEKQAVIAKNVEQVLNEAGDWLPAQIVFERCGKSDGASTEEIEIFYEELRSLDKKGIVEVAPVTDDQGRKLYDRLRIKSA